MTPISLILIVITCALVILLPRHHALKPLIAGVTLFPVGTVLVIGPMNFYAMRIFIIVGMLRVFFKREYLGHQLNNLDICMILWASVMLITRLFQPNIDTTFITRLGEVYSQAGIYFLMRFLIKSEKDMNSIIKTISVIMCILALIMLYEKLTRFNLFSLLGGKFSMALVRDGRVRCQGPFAHSILAGTVAATISIWFFASFWNKNNINSKFSFLGLLSSCMVVILSTSSGPIMSILFAFLAFAFWPLRNNMKSVRIILLLSIIILYLVMKAPVWYLISKIDLTGSSTGWHRSELIDSTIRHFNEWWLIGTPITRHWMPSGVSWSPYQTDITNHFIRNGVNGGLLSMLLFILMITYGYKYVGNSLRNMNYSANFKVFLWGLGSSLFSHTATFFSVSYFDQSISYFYLTLAMIGCAEKCIKVIET